MTKSFASVAIACLITILILFITLDVLKYAFHIGPAPEDLKRAPAARRNDGQQKKTLPLAVRFIYINELS